MDVTWSVRMPEDMKEKMSALINESGLNSKDFMAQVIQAYELKTSKDIQPVLEADIDELAQLTARIHSIFINVCERTTNIQKQKDDEFDLKLEEKQKAIAMCNVRIKMYEDKLMKAQDDIKDMERRFDDVCEQRANLNSVCESNMALIQEYKEKNDTLTGLLSEYKEYKTIIEKLQDELEAEKNNRQDLQMKLLESGNEITQLKTQLTSTKRAFEIELKQKLELSEIQKDKEVLQVRKESQQALGSAQKEYAEKTKELLAIIEKQQTIKTASKPVKRKIQTETI